MECKIDQYSQRVANLSENFPMQPNHKERLENRRKYLNINLIDKCFPSKDLWKDFICFFKKSTLKKLSFFSSAQLLSHV